MTTSAAWTVGVAAGGGKLQINNDSKLTGTTLITIATENTFQIDAGGTYEHNVSNNLSALFGGTEAFVTNSNFIVTSCATPLIGMSDNGYGNQTFNNNFKTDVCYSMKFNQLNLITKFHWHWHPMHHRQVRMKVHH